VVYDPILEGQRLIFRVSGALYNSAAILYDLQTESLWAQPIRKAITGPLTGSRLGTVPSQRTKWAGWVREHPDTEVLSIGTGYHRQYSVNPYAMYASSDELVFPAKRSKSECKLSPKARVLGVEAGGFFRAYPLNNLKKPGRVRDILGSQELEIVYDRTTNSAAGYTKDGRLAHGMVVYWFAWQAFHPETDCFRGNNRER
jgi:hypothetical protein